MKKIDFSLALPVACKLEVAGLPAMNSHAL
jgi:hypothetical protein